MVFFLSESLICCFDFLKVVFKKQLSRQQWISLVILTLGCIVKQFSTRKKSGAIAEEAGSPVSVVLSNLSSVHVVLLLVQVRPVDKKFESVDLGEKDTEWHFH